MMGTFKENIKARLSIAVRWRLKALTFRPDVKQIKSNDLASWHATPLAVIHLLAAVNFKNDGITTRTKPLRF